MSGFITVAEFWRQQPFAYLATYSFNRGPASAEEHERLVQEVAAARQALHTGRYMELRKLNQRLRELEESLRGGQYNVLLTNPIVTDYATRKIVSLTSGAAATRQLAAILEGATTQEAFAMCPPVYRDALAFYNEQQQCVRILNICFKCRIMETDAKQLVEADFATYDALQALLTGWGHPIEETE